MAAGGRQWRIPLDADTWPLTLILASRARDEHGADVVHFGAVVAALKQLLGAQWPAFVDAVRDRDGLLAATHAIAAAGGFPGDDGDLAWGRLPATIAFTVQWPGKVESDLRRFWHLDYLDRWRFRRAGRRKLTLRAIHSCLQNLPAESSIAIALNRRSASELLLMDVYKAIRGVDHPARPMTPEQAAAAREAAVVQSKARSSYQARRDRDALKRKTARETALRNVAEKRQKRGA